MQPMFSGYAWYGTYGNLGLYGSLVPYGSLKLTETSPAQSFTEPLSLSEVKAYLKLPERSPVDSVENLELTQFIVSARVQAEIMQNRDLVRKQWDLSLDYWPAFRIELRDPLVSVDLLQRKNSAGSVTAMSINDDFVVDSGKHPGCIQPAWNKTLPTFAPWPSGAILLRFTSGYAHDSVFWSNDGVLLKQGMLMLVSAWYNGRLPFVLGANSAIEYPYAVTSCLAQGAIERAR